MFIEVYNNGRLQYRWPVDLVIPDGLTWKDTARYREHLVEEYLQVLRKHVMPFADPNTTTFYLNFKSKMNDNHIQYPTAGEPGAGGNLSVPEEKDCLPDDNTGATKRIPLVR